MVGKYRVGPDPDDEDMWAILDEEGEVYEGPFDTREEAEDELEDILTDDLDQLGNFSFT